MSKRLLNKYSVLFLISTLFVSTLVYFSIVPDKTIAGTASCKEKTTGCMKAKTNCRTQLNSQGVEYTKCETYTLCGSFINQQWPIPYCSSGNPPNPNDCQCEYYYGAPCGCEIPGTIKNNPYDLNSLGVTACDGYLFSGACTSGVNKPKTCQKKNLGPLPCYPDIPQKFPDLVDVITDYNESSLGCNLPSNYIKDTTSDSSKALEWKLNEVNSSTALNTAPDTSCGGSPSSCNGSKQGYYFGLSPKDQVQVPYGSLFLNGVTNFVSNGDPKKVLNGVNGTVEAWVYPMGVGTIVAYGTNTSSFVGKCEDCIPLPFNIGYQLWTNGSDINFYKGVTRSTKVYGNRGNLKFIREDQIKCVEHANNVVKPNQWNHIVVTYDFSNAQIYVNGKRVASDLLIGGNKFSKCDYTGGNTSFSYFPSTGPFTVGRMVVSGKNNSYMRATGPEYFKGMIDEVAYYNRKLSASEVFGRYTTLSGKSVNNVAHVESVIGANYKDIAAGFKMDIVGNWYAKAASALPPVEIEKVVESGVSKALANSNSFGVFFSRSVGRNTDDIPISNFDTVSLLYQDPDSGTNVIVKEVEITEGAIAQIKDENGNKIAGITNIVIEEPSHGKWVKINYDLEFYSDLSGISNYLSAGDGIYKIFTYSDHTRAWENTGKEIYVDLTAPSVNQLNVEKDVEASTETNIRLNVEWNVSDGFTGVSKVIGDASYTSGTGSATADDLTSGVYNYVLGSGAKKKDTYLGSHLWSVSGILSRIERVNIVDADQESVGFEVGAFDNACNSNLQEESVAVLTEADPWIATKGGLAYTFGTLNLLIPEYSNDQPFSDDNYWKAPFGFIRSETDISSEIISTGSSLLHPLLHAAKIGSSRLVEYPDSYAQNGLSKRLTELISGRADSYQDLYNKVEFEGAQEFSGKVTELSGVGTKCEKDKRCWVSVNGDLTVNSGFTCDSKAAIFADNLTIYPDVLSSDRVNGCIFVVNGDTTVLDGEHKSSGSGSPKYDIFEGFVLSDGAVNLPLVDEDKETKDGLKVNGSLIGLGDGVDNGVNFERTLLRTHNSLYPVVAVHYDSKYLNIARDLFGSDFTGVKKEVGFKPF